MAEKKFDGLVNATFLAELFNLTDRRIQQLVKDKILEKSGREKYKFLHAVKAYIRFLQERGYEKTGPINSHSEKARLIKAQADKAEIEVAVMRGEMVPIETVCDEVDKMLKAFRERALNLPTKVSPTVFNQKSVDGVRKIISNEVDEVLSELKSFSPEQDRLN